MPRKRGIKQNFTFNKGWNTEASPMTFPENTAKDLDNVVLDVDGSIRRRMGVVCESATSTRYFQEIKSGFKYKAIGFFKWTNVAGSGDFNLLVSQKGTVLQFNGEDGTDYGQVDFSSRVITARASEAPNEVVETASGLGYFFVTGPSIDPFYLEYDVSTDTISLTGFEIEIRDFDGVDDGLAVDERPTTLSAAHEYNLRNQGWLDSFPCIDDAAAKSTDDTVGFTFTEIGSYPSNADVLYYGKTSSGADETEIDRYNPTVMVKNVFGTTPAPKGKYIFNAFNLDRNSIVAGATSEIVNNRPRAVGFHNGRVFFAGVNAVGYTGKVYYSQQLTNIDKIGKCYQDNDPTSEIFNDLLATDGGEIDIPNCGNILRIEEGPAGIVVFASNGMWEITGQEGKFSATEFYVRKVTDIGCVSRESVVNADGTFYYFSDAGIVGTSRDQVSGNLSADVITQTSIQLGYLLFGGPQRRGARGVWIRGEKKVVWLYSTDTTYDNVVDRFKYNGVLILDTILGAFYKYSISDFNVGEAPFVSGIVESSSTVSITAQEPVTAGAVTVTAGGLNVTTPVSGSDADTVTSTWKLQVVRPNTAGGTSAWGIDFATFASRTFTDWYFEDNVGANYTSYLETGYDYGGEAMFEKRPTYVYTYMSRVSKSNLDGGFYNIPDPTDVVISANFCDNIVLGTATAYQVANPDVAGTGNAQSWNAIGETGYSIHARNAGGPNRTIINLWQNTTQSDFQTAVNIGTVSYNTTGIETPEFIAMSRDGLSIYIGYGSGGSGGNTMYKVSLTVPFDLSTAGSRTLIVADLSVNMSASGLSKGCLSYDDSLIYLMDFATEDIHTYDTSGNYIGVLFNVTAETGGFGSLVTGMYANEDHMYILYENSGNFVYKYDITDGTLLEDIDGYSGGLNLLSPVYGSNAIGMYRNASVDADTSELYVVTSLYVMKYVFDCSLCGYLLSNYTHDAADKYTGSVGTLESSMIVVNNGTQLVTIGAGDVNNYVLSTPNDLTTATFVSTKDVSGILSTTVGIHDIKFSQDGLHGMITESNTNVIYQIALSSAFDISTISDTGNSVALQCSGGMAYNNDGTKLYVGSGTSPTTTITEYSLSSAYNISTASATGATYSRANDYNTDMVFSEDGLNLYTYDRRTASNPAIQRVALSTAWDLSTASHAEEIIIGSTVHNNTGGGGISLIEDTANSIGYLYVSHYAPDTIYQLVLSC